ncbi:MAG: nitrile hydratase subunit beta [Alphaproteobacteria bacterium]
MTGAHDMGGMHGLGPIAPETDAPVFHHSWEARVHAMTMASPTRSNIDAGRHQRELIPGPEYLRMSYYEKWLTGLCALLLKHGLVTPDELARGQPDPGRARATPLLAAAAVPGVLSRAGSYERETAAGPGFKSGDRVRALNINPTGHTRLPRYVRGRTGVVERCHGVHVFPDSNAHGQGEAAQPLYLVRFEARELWGPDASAIDTIRLDLWESYLAPA